MVQWRNEGSNLTRDKEPWTCHLILRRHHLCGHMAFRNQRNFLPWGSRIHPQKDKRDKEREREFAFSFSFSCAS
ncbi:hypothetical protein EUGRSUZ_D02145 [Eucalyptus grandis]|nr:hypothetical protein EUGRSUZ_D02145 [Eucalyptus grandis]